MKTNNISIIIEYKICGSQVLYILTHLYDLLDVKFVDYKQCSMLKWNEELFTVQI